MREVVRSVCRCGIDLQGEATRGGGKEKERKKHVGGVLSARFLCLFGRRQRHAADGVGQKKKKKRLEAAFLKDFLAI